MKFLTRLWFHVFWGLRHLQASPGPVQHAFLHGQPLLLAASSRSSCIHTEASLPDYWSFLSAPGLASPQTVIQDQGQAPMPFITKPWKAYTHAPICRVQSVTQVDTNSVCEETTQAMNSTQRRLMANLETGCQSSPSGTQRVMSPPHEKYSRLLQSPTKVSSPESTSSKFSNSSSKSSTYRHESSW